MAAWVRLAEPPEFFRATVCRAATPSTPMARISTDTITSIRLMHCWDFRAMDGMLLLTMSVVSRPGARRGGCTPDGVDPPRACADSDAVVAVQILHAQAQGAAGLGSNAVKPDRREPGFVAFTRKNGECTSH